MLHWLAGQKAPEEPDATSYEAPETPAPVFAVRAFKHAIFGTPQPGQSNGRRHSNTENGRPRHIEAKPVRPNMTRPKSASDALPLVKQDGEPAYDPMNSPTKGILMTPGASAGRKKNVTFGEDVADNEEKRPVKSGLPDDCPGKFPSPWNKQPEEGKTRDDTPDKLRGRSKLTEAFEQARDDSRKRKSKADKRGKKDGDEDNELSGEFAEPKSESGKYWKREYDVYRTNTQREVKKLITKQKAAKSYAQAKDTQCTELADQLRQEQKKVETIATKTSEFSSQMKDLEAKLQASQDLQKKHQDEIAMLKQQLGRRDSARPQSSDGAALVPLEMHHSERNAARERPKVAARVLEKVDRLNEKRSTEVEIDNADVFQRVIQPSEPPTIGGATKQEPIQRPSEPYNRSAVSEDAKANRPTLRRSAKSKQDGLRVSPTDDIWAQHDSSLATSKSTDKPPTPPKHERAVKASNDATPLKTLSINTVSSGRNSEKSSPRSLDVECKSQPDREDKVDDITFDLSEVQNESTLMSQATPGAVIAANAAGAKLAPRNRRAEDKHEASLMQVPPSSSFLLDAKASLRSTAPSGPRAQPDSKTAVPPNNTKENVSPTSKPYTPRTELSAKPSAVWSSINAAGVGVNKRSISITAKDGRQVSNDRVEAAKARIAARKATS